MAVKAEAGSGRTSAWLAAVAGESVGARGSNKLVLLAFWERLWLVLLLLFADVLLWPF